jgi:hypothetical protein
MWVSVLQRFDEQKRNFNGGLYGRSTIALVMCGISLRGDAWAVPLWTR